MIPGIGTIAQEPIATLPSELISEAPAPPPAVVGIQWSDPGQMPWCGAMYSCGIPDPPAHQAWIPEVMARAMDPQPPDGWAWDASQSIGGPDPEPEPPDVVDRRPRTDGSDTRRPRTDGSDGRRPRTDRSDGTRRPRTDEAN